MNKRFNFITFSIRQTSYQKEIVSWIFRGFACFQSGNKTGMFGSGGKN